MHVGMTVVFKQVLLSLQIFYYSTDIFETAGVKQPDVATILVGVVLVTVTIISVSYYYCHRHGNIYITMCQVILMERLGRKTLMLYGVGGMAISFTLTTICFCFQVNYKLKLSTLI